MREKRECNVTAGIKGYPRQMVFASRERSQATAAPGAWPSCLPREAGMRELAGIVRSDLDARAFSRLVRRASNSLCFAEVADVYRRAGALARAASVCARGLLRFPGYATGHVVMGEILYGEGILERARQEWLEALRLDPCHPRAHFRMAELCIVQGRTGQARRELEAALSSDASFPEARELAANLETTSRGAQAQQMSPSPDSSSETHAPGPGEAVHALLAEVLRSPFVTSALIADTSGLPIAQACGGDRAKGPGGLERTAAVGAALAGEAGRLLMCLQAGELRGVLLSGAGGAVRAVCLPQGVLIADLACDAPLAGIDADMAEAMPRLCFMGASEGDDHGLSVAP